MRFNFKKIVALGTSALMTVSGIGFAAAANFPAPFVSGGSANVAIVYGTGTGVSSLDLVEASNIQANLQTFMTGTSGGTSSSVEGGEGVIIQKSSDNWNIRDSMSSLVSTLDYEDLPTLLAKGTYVADDNDEFKYEQKITLGGVTLEHFKDSDYEDEMGLDTPTPVVGLKINSSEFVLNYTLDFTTDAESDIVSSELDDIEGSDIPLFGKTYYVSDFDSTGGVVACGATYNCLGTLTLLDSAEIGSVSEGETTTIAGHDVSIQFMDNDEVVFTVDGQRAPASGKLSAGGSYKLNDGSYIGVRDISKLEVSGEIGTASFSIGTGKIEIVSGSEVELNDEAIDGVKAWVYNSSGGTSTLAKMDKIVIEWKADEESFITPDNDVLVPGFGGLKFTMNELVRNTEEVVKVEKDGSKAMSLTLPLKDGSVTIPILFANSTGNYLGIGKDNNTRLATSGNSTIKIYEKHSGADWDKYFVATYNTSAQGESYVLRVNTEEVTGYNQTRIDKLTSSGWVNGICDDKRATDECSIGNVVLTINAVTYTSGGNRTVDIEGGTNVGFHTAITAGGLSVFLPYTINASTAATAAGAINVTQNETAGDDGLKDLWNGATAGHGYDTFWLSFDGEDKDDTISAGTGFNLTIDDTGSSDYDLQVSQIDGTGTGGSRGEEIGETDVYETYIADDVAPRILHKVPSSGADSAEVYYPTGNSETYAEIYVAEQGSTISSTTTPSGTTSLGEVLVKDSEVSSVSSKNLIVVGGSCINSVAANLVGGAYCGSAFTESTGVGSGQFLIKSYSGKYASGKIALLVAGYEVADTVNAAKYLRTQTVDTGKEYKGTSATSAELVTTEA
ncbi:MAG: hypothetical protein Q8P15_01215 [Nanoarchaeota archaeon]|nr:hypothetical protein [Nanoarchaeota archaeon]